MSAGRVGPSPGLAASKDYGLGADRGACEDCEMRLATISTPRGPRLHVRGQNGHIDAAVTAGDDRLASLQAVLDAGDEAFDALRHLEALDGTPVPEKDFLPAVPRPARIFCLGLNYAEHALEGGRVVPSWPECFLRTSSSVAAPFGDLVRPAISANLDYEGELGIVIGKGGRQIPAPQALESVAGFVVLNDASVRDWQRAGSQWTPGKNFDGTLPIGPEVVTTDEVDPDDLLLETRLNGQVMQSARTSDMLVDVRRAIEFFSTFTMLRPGDVIASGTPAGVGQARTPPVWLVPGDVVEVSIETVGTIRNRVVAEQLECSGWPWLPPGR